MKENIRVYTTSDTNESNIIKSSCKEAYVARKKLTDDEKNEFPMERFFEENGLRIKTDYDSAVTDVVFHDESKIQSVGNLREKWENFLDDSTR